LITRLRLCAYAQIVMTIVVLALWAAVLAASPAAASAKATPLTKDLQDTDSAAGVAKRVVVAPGDSLWSISAQWLGPEASTYQIADGVKRIYALNEERIGNDTNLIFAGQSLLLPKQLERQAPEPGSAAPAGRALGEADHKEGQARNEARSEPASLPGPARPVPVAAVGLLAPHDLPPSLAKPGTPNTRSVSFSAVVGTVGEAFSLGAYSERKVLGGALLAMSSVLALVLALRVAREALGPSYARRKARERWTREALSRSYAANGTFDTGDAFVAAFEGSHPSEDSPQAASTQGRGGGRSPDARALRAPEPGSALLDTARNIARRRQVRMRRTRPLTAKRPSRGHVKRTSGAAYLSQARKRPVSRAYRARALNRKGGKIVGTEPREPHPTQGWKIGEPLTSAMGAIPVQPGAPLRDALLEVKPLVADELTTVALLERHRSLSEKEQRQARALQRFLATIEDVSNEAGSR
jgi:hypothetical protein